MQRVACREAVRLVYARLLAGLAELLDVPLMRHRGGSLTPVAVPKTGPPRDVGCARAARAKKFLGLPHYGRQFFADLNLAHASIRVGRWTACRTRSAASPASSAPAEDLRRGEQDPASH